MWAYCRVQPPTKFPYQKLGLKMNEIQMTSNLAGEIDVQALLTLTKSDDERVRLGAIQAALDRGWGKPTQAVDLGGEMAITKIERVIVDSANRDR